MQQSAHRVSFRLLSRRPEGRRPQIPSSGTSSPPRSTQFKCPGRLLKYRRNLGQHFVHDRVWNAFQLPAAARGEIESARLVAADNSRRFGSGACQRNGKTCRPREITAARDRQNYGEFRYPAEGLRRRDQDRTATFLLVPRRRIETNEPDFAALHQMSSPPTGLLSSHSCSCLLRGAFGLHWARSSSKVYRRRFWGSTTRWPFSTAIPTLAPGCKCRISSSAGGTASMTEPPTLRSLVMCMAISLVIFKYNTAGTEFKTPGLRAFSDDPGLPPVSVAKFSFPVWF